MPAESMAGLLQGGVIERSWIGGRMFGNAWLVNSKTGEGAWVGATHKVVSPVTPAASVCHMFYSMTCACSPGMRRVRRCCLAGLHVVRVTNATALPAQASIMQRRQKR